MIVRPMQALVRQSLLLVVPIDLRIVGQLDSYRT